MTQFLESAGSRPIVPTAPLRKRQREAKAIEQQQREHERATKRLSQRYNDEMRPLDLSETDGGGPQFTVQLNDRRFKQVNMQQILDNLKLYDTSDLIRFPVDMLNNTCLGGDIIIKIPGFRFSREHQEWLSMVLKQLGQDALRMRDSNSFVACTWIPRPAPLRGEPVVLNMDNVLAMHHRGVFNKDDWVFIEKPDVSRLGGDFNPVQMQGRILEQVFVFTERGPDSAGNISSRVSRVRPRLSSLRMLELCESRADIRRSNPDIIVESDLEKVDDERARPSSTGMLQQALAAQRAGLLGRGQFVDIADKTIDSMARKQWESAYAQYHGERTQHTQATHEDLEMTPQTASVLQEAALMYDLRNAPVHGYKYELPPGHRVARTQLPEAPANITDVQLLTQQKVSMTWGVPPAMFQAESSQGRVTAVDHNMLTTW